MKLSVWKTRILTTQAISRWINVCSQKLLMLPQLQREAPQKAKKILLVMHPVCVFISKELEVVYLRPFAD